ncbi:hypothetical protein [Halovivax gelatinilyticus]|uniref:hypothetical protein n=1 Tax=Halovivax gelatinilyticus TaxID=2961597 RepID=UPI0020CA6762|nr:hypothetical protein [Halovivax gelatinilyticus]
MNRRALIATLATIGTVGCLDTLDGDDDGSEDDEPTGSPATGSSTRYETCEREVVSYGEFPDDVQAEIDEAIDGGYEAEEIHLASAIDVDETYVSHDRAYYLATIEADGERYRLDLEADDEPELSPRRFTLENETGSAVTGTVTVRTSDGETLVETDVDVEPDSDSTAASITRIGVHAMEVDLDGRDPVEESVGVSVSSFDGHVEVFDEEIIVSQAVADLAPCPWDE